MLVYSSLGVGGMIFLGHDSGFSALPCLFFQISMVLWDFFLVFEIWNCRMVLELGAEVVSGKFAKA